ncbi:MAG: SDR family oxidoreductase [Deltaproteobacteria bacterium]|jgi:short-subunit dehydrogenase|nr:SDR family oxidoreductase [Deltaproteobacteria bacterium]MCW8891871.1 SDR family oxidoreductase [Deltaproteobacteria bacterium]MCW9049401.1 SDR family oxidoreductase [Deltaproteobacteria bacterium]
MKSFTDKTIWITGASSGIGAALARALAPRGARLILSARSADKLEAVRQSCSRSDEHLCLVMDVAEQASIEAAWNRLQELSYPVEMLINNAGMTQRALVTETGMEVYRLLLEVNFLAAVDLTKKVLPQMLERGAGQIVSVSSLMGKFASPQRSGYAAAKHALQGFMDALRAEVQAAGIRVLVASPGFVNTDVSRNALRGDGTLHGKMDPSQAAAISAEICAEQIIIAMARGRAEVFPGGKERIGLLLHRISPALLRWVMRKVQVD